MTSREQEEEAIHCAELRALPLELRLTEIARLLGEIKATGSHPRSSKPVISIEDVTDALGGELAAAAILPSYTHLSKPETFMVPTREGEMASWLVHIEWMFTDALDPQKVIKGASWDTGPNISGAVSFALKRPFKAIFSLVDADPAAQGGAPEPGYAQPGAAPKCPSCGSKIYESKFAAGQWYCNEKYGGCGWKGPKPGMTKRVATLPAGALGDSPPPPGDGEIPFDQASEETQEAYSAEVRSRYEADKQRLKEKPFASRSSTVIGPTPKATPAAPHAFDKVIALALEIKTKELGPDAAKDAVLRAAQDGLDLSSKAKFGVAFSDLSEGETAQLIPILEARLKGARPSMVAMLDKAQAEQQGEQ